MVEGVARESVEVDNAGRFVILLLESEGEPSNADMYEAASSWAEPLELRYIERPGDSTIVAMGPRRLPFLGRAAGKLDRSLSESVVENEEG